MTTAVIQSGEILHQAVQATHYATIVMSIITAPARIAEGSSTMTTPIMMKTVIIPIAEIVMKN